MPQTLYIRTPFQPVDGSTAGDYQLTNDSLQSLEVNVNIAAPERLKLQPVFPGQITFKPLNGDPLSQDPSAPGSPAIRGDLFLELSADGQTALRTADARLGYGLIFAYLGVIIDPTFFQKTVIKALKRGNGFKTVTEGATTLATKQQISNAFARGALSVPIIPDKTTATFDFAKLVQGPGATTSMVRLVAGVRPRLNPYDKPHTLAALTGAEILADPDFVPIPVVYLYRMLAHLPSWQTTLAADGHASHPFIASILGTEAPSGSPPQVTRWRRLHFQVPELFQAAPTACHAFEGTTAKARPAPLVAELWTAPVNLLGEVFIRRSDGEAFRIEMRDRHGAPVQLSRPPFSDPAALTWEAPAPGAQPADFELQAHLPITNDPLASPFSAIPYGAYEKAGLTVVADGATLRVLARGKLITPLKDLLRDFGFHIVTDTETFDRRLSWALREFQIYAGMETIAVEGNPGAPHYADRLTATNNTARYAGEIHGLFSTLTAATMLAWRQNSFRCPVVIESWTVQSGAQPTRILLTTENMWRIADNTVDTNRVFVRDLTDYYTFPKSRLTSPDRRILLGRYENTDTRSPPDLTHVLLDDNMDGAGPLCSRKSNITWDPDTDVTPERLVGRTLPTNPVAGTADDDTVSTYKVINSVSLVENERAFDSVNGYDLAVMSMGVQHWTLSRGEELGPYLAFLHTYEPTACELFFGRFGIRCSLEWPAGTAETNAMYQLAKSWSAPIQQQGLPHTDADGNLTTDANWQSLPPARNRKDYLDANYLRTWHWFYRWVMAARTGPAVQRRQWDYGRLRLNAILNADWGMPAFSSIKQVYSSERMVTALLRAHVNWPASVIEIVPIPGDLHGKKKGQASADVRLAFSESNLNNIPSTWSQANIDTLQNNLEKRLRAAMPKNNRHTLATALDYNNPPFGALKTEKDTFKFDTTGLNQL